MGSLFRETPQLRSWVYLHYTLDHHCSTEPSRRPVEARLAWGRLSVGGSEHSGATGSPLAISRIRNGHLNHPVVNRVRRSAVRVDPSRENKGLPRLIGVRSRFRLTIIA